VKRVGLLVIGDEILAGHTHDTNSHWLAKRCATLGLQLARIETCTDELEDVKTSIRRFLEDIDVDYVVTSGGLGPTPDDRTMEGLAMALDVPLVLRDEDLAWMRKRVAHGHELGYFEGAEPNEGMMKMAYLPAQSEAMPNQLGTCLGAVVEHNGRSLFTLPGVPREFERMFDETVAPRLIGSEAPHVEELTIYSEESRFFSALVALEKEFPRVTIGSYPQRGHITIRATGRPADTRAAIAAMRAAAADYLSPREKST
jgi:nicotinamide-nucleotide amidase